MGASFRPTPRCNGTTTMPMPTSAADISRRCSRQQRLRSVPIEMQLWVKVQRVDSTGQLHRVGLSQPHRQSCSGSPRRRQRFRSSHCRAPRTNGSPAGGERREEWIARGSALWMKVARIRDGSQCNRWNRETIIETEVLNGFDMMWRERLRETETDRQCDKEVLHVFDRI